MNLVATYNFGDVWYADYTVPFMRRYAERAGADFLEFKCFPNRHLYGPVHSWFHVEAIKILAGQGYYQTMLLLDAASSGKKRIVRMTSGARAAIMLWSRFCHCLNTPA